MKKFLIRSGLFIGLLTLLAWLSLFLPDHEHRNTLLYAQSQKQEALEKIDQPKVLFVGGSNLSFGLNTETVGINMFRPAYNLGMHAGLGLNYMLEDARNYIDSGDIVVVIPEYELFADEFYGSKEFLTMVLDVNSDNGQSWSWSQWGAMLNHLPGYIGTKYYNAFLGLFTDPTPSVLPIYAREAFDAFGDVKEELQRPAVAFPVDSMLVSDYSDALVHLEAFAQDVEARKARFCLSFPSFEADNFDASEPFISALSDSLDARGLNVISSPNDYRLDRGLFFNTKYHLSLEGRELRTRLLVADLTRFLAGDKK